MKLQLDSPSQSMRTRWANRMDKGTATAVTVFVGGAWSLNLKRGHKRDMRLPFTGASTERS